MAGDPPQGSFGNYGNYYAGYTCNQCGQFVAWGLAHTCQVAPNPLPYTSYTLYPSEVQQLREYVVARLDLLEGKLDALIKMNKLIERIDKILAEWEKEDEQGDSV
jgi:hypothetical protein